MINILDKKIADKIAAGEVIDRPVSIVKELIENSIDAGASAITLQIKNGGKTYIRVTDNGCGIKSHEAETAFKRHATSKLSSVDDLTAIDTLGFRGEALASICAVSRVELITKTSEDRSGCKIVVEGSQTLENTITGCPDGTTITVSDLFYNMPARKKFLSTDNGETRRIVDMVSRIALSYSDIKFSLINGNTNVFTTPGRGNILNNILTVYGSELGRDLLPVDYSRDGFVLKGFVSNPGVSLASRSRQIFAVNGRVVSSKILEKAVDDAYKEKLFTGRFPIAFLFLALPAHKVDVNIHPTKKEIRFDDGGEIEDFVKEGIGQALAVKEAVPQVRAAHVKAKEMEEERDEINPKSMELSEAKTINPKKNPEAKAPEIKSKDTQVDINSLLSGLREESPKVEEKLWPEKPDYRPFDIDKIEIIGTVFYTYILAYDDDSMFLIDQHAAHERIFYEKLISQYESEEKLCQQLLIPLNFNVDAQVYATESMWIDDIRAMGYDIENFGERMYIVRQVPAFMDIAEAETLLKDLFTEFQGKPDLSNRATLDKIITRSCKSAIKGGDSLEPDEINALMKDLKTCINPFSCPHGRPTFIRMTKYDIEKMFKRV